MHMLTFILLFTCLFLLGLTYLLYFILKKLRLRKTGKIIAIVLATLIISGTLKEVFKDDLFSKSSAKKLLLEQHITLNDDFELTHNEFRESLLFYSFHTFTLTISEQDKKKIINEIKTAQNFNPNGNGNTKFYDGPRIENFEETNYFTRVLVREKDKDYPLNFSKTRVSKDELKLVFEDKKDGWDF